MTFKQEHAEISFVQDLKAVKHDADKLGAVWTLTWAEIADWQKDNEYIVTGYRRVQNSWQGCLRSIFGYLHNETVNIHTHLWGAVFFLFLLAANQSFVVTRYPTAGWADTAMFSIFLGSAAFCLLASSAFHTGLCHSEEMHGRCHALDYTGIITMILGSFSPAIYYMFFCTPRTQLVYLTTFMLPGLGAAYIVLSSEYSKPSHRGARTKVFLTLGLSTIGPFMHGLFAHGLHTTGVELGFRWIVVSGVLYIGGTLLYVFRIPERFSPGRFDYFFASHQIFHVAIILAALAHYAVVLSAFDHWHGRHAGVCPVSHAF